MDSKDSCFASSKGTYFCTSDTVSIRVELINLIISCLNSNIQLDWFSASEGMGLTGLSRPRKMIKFLKNGSGDSVFLTSIRDNIHKQLELISSTPT